MGWARAVVPACLAVVLACPACLAAVPACPACLAAVLACLACLEAVLPCPAAAAAAWRAVAGCSPALLGKEGQTAEEAAAAAAPKRKSSLVCRRRVAVAVERCRHLAGRPAADRGTAVVREAERCRAVGHLAAAVPEAEHRRMGLVAERHRVVGRREAACREAACREAACPGAACPEAACPEAACPEAVRLAEARPGDPMSSRRWLGSTSRHRRSHRAPRPNLLAVVVVQPAVAGQTVAGQTMADQQERCRRSRSPSPS